MSISSHMNKNGGQKKKSVEQLLAFVELQVPVGDNLGVVRKHHYIMPVPGGLGFTCCIHYAFPVLKPQESG